MLLREVFYIRNTIGQRIGTQDDYISVGVNDFLGKRVEISIFLRIDLVQNCL